MQKSAPIPCLDPLLELAGLSKSMSMFLDERLGQCGVPKSEQHSQGLRAHCPHDVLSVMGHIATSATSPKCSIFWQLQLRTKKK